ncbi:MAG: ABC transporter ATP-binding protein [Sedimentisphaerales bacterium]|nr:ABC transporter ATP-binding protein [Sedimentisphaerales bacterium]
MENLNKTKKNFLRFLTYVRPYWGYLTLGVIGGIVKFVLPLLVPQVTRYLLDDVFLSPILTTARKYHELLVYTLGLIGVFILVYGPFVYIRHFYADKASHRAVFNLRCDLYYHILRMSASFFTRNKTGEIVSRLISDVLLTQQLVGTALTNIWMDLAALFVVLFFLVRIDLPTSLIALANFPIYLYFFRKFNREIRSTTIKIQDDLAAMTGNINEKIAGSVVIRAFTRERKEGKAFQNDSEKLFSTNMRRIIVQSLNQAITGTLVGIGPLVVLAFGGYRLINGDITPGELIAVTMYLAPLYLPLQRFSELNVVFANSLAALDRVFEIMDQTPEVVDRPNALRLENCIGKVEFDNVCFDYGKGCPVVHNVSFIAQPGEKIALVGPSGSGKTTIASLIPRFYDINQGAIRIDGHDVRDINLRSLRRHIGMVLQDPILFSGTIRENILYGKPNAGDEEIIHACHSAHAYNFINELPSGFDTEVGERGSQLSGGQRQRISIARAFLKNPKILVLDEATSSLDSESERLIQNAMEQLLKNRTTFIIAHRLSTIIHADRILVLSNGQISDIGTHHQLLKTSTLYQQLYQRQFDPDR